jgi:hypothetical protein
MGSVKKARIRIRGKWWSIRVERPPLKEKVEGLCDYDKRVIYLRPGTDLPATLIHEILHACYPDMDEAAILDGETAIMNGIIKMKLTTHESNP